MLRKRLWSSKSDNLMWRRQPIQNEIKINSPPSGEKYKISLPTDVQISPWDTHGTPMGVSRGPWVLAEAHGC